MGVNVRQKVKSKGKLWWIFGQAIEGGNAGGYFFSSLAM